MVAIPENDELVLWWAYFAWMIYEGRLEGASEFSIEETTDKIKAIFGEKWRGLWDDYHIMLSFFSKSVWIFDAYCQIAGFSLSKKVTI